MISTYVFTFGMGFTIDISCAVCTKCWVKTNNQPKTNKQSQTMHNGWKKVKLVYIVFRPRYFNIFFYFIYGICFHILNLLSISDKIGSYKQMICFFYYFLWIWLNVPVRNWSDKERMTRTVKKRKKEKKKENRAKLEVAKWT